MAGSFRMAGDGVAATVSALTSHGNSAAESARGVESALADLDASVRSPQLAAAVGSFVARFTTQAAKVGEHIDALGAGLESVSSIVAATDRQLAGRVPGARQ